MNKTQKRHTIYLDGRRVRVKMFKLLALLDAGRDVKGQAAELLKQIFNVDTPGKRG